MRENQTGIKIQTFLYEDFYHANFVEASEAFFSFISLTSVHHSHFSKKAKEAENNFEGRRRKIVDLFGFNGI